MTFSWYQEKSELTDNYYEGTYEFFTGAEALAYITFDLSDYGVTYDEVMDNIERNNDRSLNTFVVLVLNNNKMVVDGEDKLDEPFVTPCFGFYYEDEEYLDLANMNTATYWGFTKVDE